MGLTNEVDKCTDIFLEYGGCSFQGSEASFDTYLEQTQEMLRPQTYR